MEREERHPRRRAEHRIGVIDANTVQSRDPLQRTIRKSRVTIAHALFLDGVASSRGGRKERAFPYTDYRYVRIQRVCFFAV